MPVKRNSRTLNKEDMSHFRIVLNPIELSPEEDKARLKRLCRLIFPHLSVNGTYSQKKKKEKISA